MLNVNTGKKERIQRLLRMHANKREDLTEARTGDIVAAVGFKEIRTGDTLTALEAPLLLEPMNFAEPVIYMAIEPRTKADQDKLGEALQAMADEDPSFHVRKDPDSGQTVIWGMGELHLEIIIDRLLREHKVACNVGRPQVAYRETVSRAGRPGGRVRSRAPAARPISPGSSWSSPRANTGRESPSSTRSGRVEIPAEFVPFIEDSARQACDTGVLAGYPLVDVAIRLDRRRLRGGAVDGDGVPERGGQRPLGRRQARGSCPAGACHGRGDLRSGGIPRRRDRPPELPARPGDGMEQRGTTRSSRRRFPWSRCSATRHSCAR